MAEEQKFTPFPDGVPADFNEEEEAALNEFMDQEAFGAIVESLGEAFSEEINSNVGSSALLATVMEEHLADPEKKADFTVDLMQKDEMLQLGMLGDEFETLVTQEEYNHLQADRVVQLVSQSQFAGKLHTSDPAVIELTFRDKFQDNTTGEYTFRNVVSLTKSLMIAYTIEERQKSTN